MIRICLGCSKPFKSLHKGNRLCAPCNYRNNDLQGEVRHKIAEEFNLIARMSTDPIRKIGNISTISLLREDA